MGSNWEVKKLGDVINLKRGYDLPASKRIDGEVPIMASSGITGYHNEAKVQGPGVITGRSGQLGKVFYVEENYWALNTTLYVENFKGNYPKFIYYLLQTLNFEQFNAGSSVPTLNRNHVHQLEVRIPSLGQQQKIGDSLYKFEEKVIVNKKLIDKLEEIVQTLFKRWFIDFEFSNEQGLPYRSSGGEMVESELGEIPKDWSIYKLGEFAESISKSINKKEVKYARFLNTSDIEQGRIKEVNLTLTSEMPGQAKKLIQKGDILYSEIRPKNKRYAYVDFEADEYVVSTKLMVIRVNDDVYSNKLLYMWLTQEETVNTLQQIAEDRSGTFPQITFSILSNFQFAIPCRRKLKELEILLVSLFEKIIALKKENEKLFELRDTLLPKLLSGEIEIPDESVVES